MPTYLKDDTQKESTIALIYGGAGSGKTWWAASAPRPVVFTDRNGLVTLKSKGWRSAHPNANPQIVRLNMDETPLNPRAFDQIRNQMDQLFSKENLDTFDTIIIDDIDFARTAARNKAVVLNGLDGRSKTSSMERQNPMFKDVFLLKRQDFGTEMGLVDNFLLELTSGCREYSKNLIVCAHELRSMKQDDKGNNFLESVKPLFTGQKTPDNITRYFDIVWYLHTIGAGSAIKREFVTDKESYYPCKTRWSGLFKNPERDVTAAQVFQRIDEYQESILPKTTS